ncbi:helix-turn-helix domain-containing protein [Pseudomonas aeruginosa]|uniref:helix-turn-helix domain-containing protein n=1 Tax=Pseudomonas aeruginosa TaxID=287 RepID=UPI000F53050F|nr:helix-turn-helix transcriptional regulator [Pseudomonas aeruginosa]RQB68770.1 transcriptional regulator [Pseudomonas aeruginosa]
MDLDELIARRLSSLRKEQGLTLAQLAERCGVSKAMISRIERNESSPSASVLGRLAGGLGIGLSELLGETQALATPLCRREHQEVWEDPASGYRRRQVASRDPRSGCEMVEVEIPAHTRLDYPRWGGRPYRQRLWLVEGALRVDYGEQSFHLQRGDRLDFGVDRAVVFVTAAQPCRYLLVLLHD